MRRDQGGTVRYFAWDGDNQEAIYTTAGVANWRFLTPYLDDNLSTQTGGSVYYYLHDGLGSVRNIEDSSEAVQSTYDSRAFGVDQGSYTVNVSNPFKFTGAYYDWWEGPMYYLRNRYYLPTVGLFASRDVIEADAAREWEYVGNAPSVRVDSFGLCDLCGFGEYGTPQRAQYDGDDPEAEDSYPQRAINWLYAHVAPTPSYGFFDCLSHCIERCDPANAIPRSIYDMTGNPIQKALSEGLYNKSLFTAFGGVLTKNQAAPILRIFTGHGAIQFAGKQVAPIARFFTVEANWTSFSSLTSAVFRMGTRSAPRMAARASTSILGPIWIGYGQLMAGIELYCAKICHENPNCER